MNIKVEFKKMSLGDNIEMIKDFLSGDKDNIYYATIKCFPELEHLNSITDEDIRRVITKKYNENEKLIEDAIEKYNIIWNEYNDIYLKTLEDYFGCSFPSNINKIDASIGITFVCPRYLDNYSFVINPYANKNKLIEIVAHEILHFMWFNKWSVLYPETERTHYDNPYLEWEYSEVVVDPVLNNLPFKELFNINAKSYDYFYEMDDLVDSLKNIYQTTDSIENKIANGYKIFNKYKENTNSKKM